MFDMMKNTGVIIEGERVENDTVSALVLISLFTDARAQESDTLPDNSRNLRGWPGDSFYDAPWGSKLWLLYREKLTTDVRNRAVKYAEDALPISTMLLDLPFTLAINLEASGFNCRVLYCSSGFGFK
ncbi:Phage protein GP46 [Enterovibrio nigricans DSM 22720]|uniref:Phage protein GP46 n=1 Tax=Enterovibrio nigricans DSM 22720 TaxID=1121868 RepID=A0A1T4VWG8_9GAMM|nr:Phage protein GP46 [Enterovibrio nigricans DSM 22720]